MGDKTGIEWTDATWNPVTGCSVVSPGCTNCYAMRLAGTRLRHHPSRAGLTAATKAGPVWNGMVRLNAPWLDQPLGWRKPRRIFVCAHGDLFHESVPDEWIDRVFAVMALAPQHTFQVLTKRSGRMREYMQESFGRIADAVQPMRTDDNRVVGPLPNIEPGRRWWPLQNVWLGVSAEDQTRAEERVPDLLATQAAVRFVSCEPLLGEIDLTRLRPPGHSGWIDALGGREHIGPAIITGGPRLGWAIVGDESGPGARPGNIAAHRALRDQCAAAAVPFFEKQVCVNGRKAAIPDDLMVRQWPGSVR